MSLLWGLWITCSFPESISLWERGTFISSIHPCHPSPWHPIIHGAERLCWLSRPQLKNTAKFSDGEERKMNGWSKRTKCNGRCPWNPLEGILPRQFTKDPCAPLTKVNVCRKAQEMLKGRLVETDLHRCSKSHHPTTQSSLASSSKSSNGHRVPLDGPGLMCSGGTGPCWVPFQSPRPAWVPARGISKPEFMSPS